MTWDEGRLLALEIDANYGLTPDPDTPQAALRDPSLVAVWAWSPRARLLALAPGLALPSSIGGMEQEYSPGKPPDALHGLVASLDDRTVSVEGARVSSSRTVSPSQTQPRCPSSPQPPTASAPPST